MIIFNYENDFRLDRSDKVSEWIKEVIKEEEFNLGEINYVFCSDTYLHRLNVEFLEHDTYTDVIGFDYSVGKKLQGEIYISTDRVKENAIKFEVPFDDELHRVMCHGVLHFCGYGDATAEDKIKIREKEDFYLAALHKIS